MPYGTITKTDIVVVVVIDGETGRLVLVMDRTKDVPQWNFPGGPISDKDAVPSNVCRESAPAYNAAMRVVWERIRLEVRICRIQKRVRRSGALYVYVALADFSGLVETAANAEKCVKIFSQEEIGQIDLPPLHRGIFFDVRQWILEQRT